MLEKIDLKTRSKFGNDWTFDPKRLALVHVTKYMPQKNGDHWEIQSTAEATDYTECRNTIHFTVGHHVESHFMGNWEENGIMVITPFMGVIEQNEKPLGISSVDTWFETTPGHNLKLPKGTEIFCPATDEKDLAGKLTKTEGDITYYKAHHFTTKEKKQIFDAITHPNPYDYYKEEPIYMSELSEYGIESDEWTASWETVRALPDSFFARKMKEVLLMNCTAKNGYLSNQEWKFSSDSSKGASEVAELGEKLGCRFYGAERDLHHSNANFELGFIRNLSRDLKDLDFIFHPEKYKIAGYRKDYDEYLFSAGTAQSTFGMKLEGLDSYPDGEEIIKVFEEISDKEIVDQIEENIKKMGKQARTTEYSYNQDWTEAFKATYAVWAKKNIERLRQYHKMSKGFDLDTWYSDRTEQMTAYMQSQKRRGLKDLLAEKSMELDTASAQERKALEKAGTLSKKEAKALHDAEQIARLNKRKEMLAQK